jgi:PhnB protein
MNIGLGLCVKNSAEAVELYKDGEEFLSVIEAPKDGGKNDIVQLGVTLADEAEVRKAFELLSVGGTVKTPVGPLPWSPCSGEVVDKFGVWWFVTAPMHHPPEDFDPEAPWDASMYKKPE